MRGLDLYRQEHIIDYGASEGYVAFGTDISPTLTRQGSSRLWSLTRGRLLTIGELARLQGFDHRCFDWPDSRTFGAGFAGNSMSVCVLQRLVCAISKCLGDSFPHVEDPWSVGIGQWALVLAAISEPWQ